MSSPSGNFFRSMRSPYAPENPWPYFGSITPDFGSITLENPSLFSYDNSNQTQLNHLDKSNEGGGSGSGSGDKPAEGSVMDQQLNHLDRVKMHIKQLPWYRPFLDSIAVADLINVYKEEKEKLRIYFEKLPCRFSLMINIDESVCEECICFSVYFIDDDWKLKEKIISWKRIGGDPIMKIFKNVLSEWGIDNNISYMVLDGHSYEHVLNSNERENGFSSQGSLLFNGKLFCIRDFHSIAIFNSNTIVEILFDHIVERLYVRMQEIFEYFLIAIDRAKSLGKQVTTKFIPTEQDLEDMDAELLLEKALGLKEAFFELENMESEFKSINLTKEEWDLITTFSDFHDDERDDETANMYFPRVCNKYTMCLEFVKLKPSIYEKESFHSLRDGMKCWYDDNLVLAVAAVLDPRFKMDIVKHWYKKIYGDEYETRLAIFTGYLTNVYNEYAKATNGFRSYEMLDPSGQPCEFSFDHPSNFELDRYLKDVKFASFRKFDILEWWRFNTQYFPTLARMARDFLSIKITIPYAYLFHRIPRPHMHLDSDRVEEEAFVCVRNWLKS